MAKNQARFDRLIFCINSSENGLIPYEHSPVSIPTQEVTTPEEFESFPIVMKEQQGGIERLSFWLSSRELTDGDVEKLISSIISKPLLAEKFVELIFSSNNLKRTPVFLKTDFPSLRHCYIDGNPITSKSELPSLILNMRIGIPAGRGVLSPVILNNNILDAYFTSALTGCLMSSYRNLVTLLSLNSHGKALCNDINIGLMINSFLVPQHEKIFESDISNIEKSLEINEQMARLALVQKYKKERLPRLFKSYNKKLANAESNPKVKSLCDLNLFLNKNGFNAEELHMKNAGGYTPRYLSAKNMALNFVGLRNDDEDCWLITKALYNRRSAPKH